MVHVKKNSRIFFSNKAGAVSVYSLATFPPTLLNRIQTSDKTSVRGLHVDYKSMYNFTGATSGKVCVLDLNIPGKEILIREISAHKPNKKVIVINSD
jgi:hypothetical protein